MQKSNRCLIALVAISALCVACQPQVPPVSPISSNQSDQQPVAPSDTSTKDMLIGGAVGAAAGYMLGNRNSNRNQGSGGGYAPQPIQQTVVRKTTIIQHNYASPKPSSSRTSFRASPRRR